MNRAAVHASLAAAVAAPFLYYGAQVASFRYFPDYSFIKHAASLLGSDLSTNPGVFNAFAMATGVALAIAAPGLGAGLRKLGAPSVLCILIAASVLTNAYTSFRAGWFPLPDPRHGSGPAMAGVLPFSLLALLAVWSRSGIAMRLYLIASVGLVGVMIPIMSGLTGIDRESYGGLLQRIATLAIFPPVGVVGCWTLLRLRAAQPQLSASHHSSRGATHAPESPAIAP